jgi:glycosyltransferase involved in cell wall biosynthesis
MRILHLIHQYLPEKIGGTELYTRTLAQQQRQQGHHVAIFTPSRQSPAAGSRYLREVADEGIVYRVPLGERSDTAVFAATFRPIWTRPPLALALAEVLAAETPDLVHIQHLMGMPAGLIHQVQQAGLPYIVTLHDYWHLCANAQLVTNYDNQVCQGPNWWLNCAHCALARIGQPRLLPLIPAVAPLFAYREQRLRQVLNQAAGLIAPTHFTAGIHAQMGLDPDRITVIPHGIKVPSQLPAATRPAEDQRLHIGYIGGLSWQKGVHVLLEAVNQLPAADFKLTIYGDSSAFPDYVDKLHQMAYHPAIHFAGRLPHRQLWAALANLDVVVVPSLWYETASLIVQEAFAAGVPVIASDLGALQERVAHGVDGYHFPPGDAPALADYLRQLQQSPAILRRLRAGIQPVKTIESHTAEVLALYQETIG